MDFITRFKGKVSTIGKDGEMGLVAGTSQTNMYPQNSNVTVMTNIDNARNSQVNYNKKKPQAPQTQYGPYTNGAMGGEMFPMNGGDSSKFEIMSDGAHPKYRAPATMQEFQHSNHESINDSFSDNYGARGAPSYHKMKNKLNSMRKQNTSNVVNNVLGSNKINKPSKASAGRNKSVDEEIETGNEALDQEEKPVNKTNRNIRERREELKKDKIKSKSQYRHPRPPLPVNTNQNISNAIQKNGNSKTKRTEGKYNTDIEDVKRQSMIPRLSKASAERVPQPKKYIPESEYAPESSAKKPQMRRSHSFLQNKSRKVNPEASKAHNSRKIANSAAKAMVDGKAESRRSVNYKPYTLREYKDMFDKADDFVTKVRGGLGANIGNEKWQKEHEKRQRMKEFASKMKQQSHLGSDSIRRTSQTQNVDNREK